MKEKPKTAWELGGLLEPVHCHKRGVVRDPKERPHYPWILSFIYRNRYVIGSQIERKFGSVMGSSRSRRRQLGELEALGWVDLVECRGTSPLFPKVFRLSSKGAKRLKQAMAEHGDPGQASVRAERSRARGYSHDHVLHELLITEFLLTAHLTDQAVNGIELVRVERRSLAKHPAFTLPSRKRASRLVPDCLFVTRNAMGQVLVVCAEIDTGSMNSRQLRAKFERYVTWLQLNTAHEYLCKLQRRCGATDPRGLFRLLFISGNRSNGSEASRLAECLAIAMEFPELAKRTWGTTAGALCKVQHAKAPLIAPLWLRIADLGAHLEPVGVGGSARSREERQTRVLALIPHITRHPLYRVANPKRVSA